MRDVASHFESSDSLPRWQDLGLPQPFIDLTQKHRGLVLCTGPTGSGKSTTRRVYQLHSGDTKTSYPHHRGPD